MTIESTSVDAGWYADPAGSPAMRWWDGTQWTTHLHQAAPPAPTPPTPVVQVAPLQQLQPQPIAQAPVRVQLAPPEADINLSAYRPGVGYGAAPANGFARDGYTRTSPVQTGPVNNRVAYFSLVVGIIAITSIFLRLSLPNGSYYLPVFGLTATFAGIRAIARFRRRRVTALWAGIVGLSLGVIAEILLVATFIIPTVISASSPPVAGLIGPTGPITTYYMGVGSVEYLPESNGTLQQAAADEARLVSILKADYAPSTTSIAADGSWPTRLTVDSQGDVRAPDGRDFGNIVQAGWHVAYEIEPDGSYLLGVTGPDTSEISLYSSETERFAVTCKTSDQTCATKSPMPPVTSNQQPGTSTTPGSTA